MDEKTLSFTPPTPAVQSVSVNTSNKLVAPKASSFLSANPEFGKATDISQLKTKTQNISASSNITNVSGELSANSGDFSDSLSVNGADVLTAMEKNYTAKLSRVETGNSITVLDNASQSIKTMKEVLYFIVYSDEISAGSSVQFTVSKCFINTVKMDVVGIRLIYDSYASKLGNIRQTNAVEVITNGNSSANFSQIYVTNHSPVTLARIIITVTAAE